MNPTALFASLTLQRNTQVQMHRDAGNEPNTANTAIPCSRWRGGSLWVQSDGGAYALDRATGPGTMIRIGLPYAQFPPHRFHATVPWSGEIVRFCWVHATANGASSGIRSHATDHFGFSTTCCN